MKRLCAALAACCVFCFAASSEGQTTAAAAPAQGRSPAAAIALDGGGSLKAHSAEGLFERVAAVTNQAVVVRLQYGTDLGGKPILIESLDGAEVLGNTTNLTLGADGSATVRLRLGARRSPSRKKP